MKLLPIAAVLAGVVVAPAFAQQAPTAAPANKVDCEKAKMKWDEKGNAGKGACVAAAPAAKDAVKK
jgi:hypothetical protein